MGNIVLGLIFFATFVVVLILISLGKAEESVVTLLTASVIGLILMFVEGLTFEELMEFINLRLVLAFFGIMLMVQISAESGVFHWIAIKAVKFSKANPVKMFVILNLMAAFMAMFISALAAILIIGSLTIMIAKTLKVEPSPYMMAEAIMVDIGSLGLMFSFPAIIMTQMVELDLAFFVLYLLPFSMLAIGLSIYYLHSFFGGRIEPVSERRKMLLMDFDEWTLVPNKRAFYSTATLLIVILLLMLAFQQIHIIAFVGSIIMLFAAGVDPHRIFKDIPWSQLLFIIALSVIVEAINHEGVLLLMASGISAMTGGNVLLMLLIVLWIGGLLSGVIDNIPIVLTFVPIISALAEMAGFSDATLAAFWATLLIATNVGGNLQTFGSSTTILAKGLTEESGFSFDKKVFLDVGLSWTVLHLVIATPYVVLRYAEESIVSVLGAPLFYVLLYLPGSLILLYIALDILDRVPGPMRKAASYISRAAKASASLLKKLRSIGIARSR